MLGTVIKHPILTGLTLLLVNIAVFVSVILLLPQTKTGQIGEHYTFGPSNLPYRHDASKELTEAKEEFEKAENEDGPEAEALIPMLDQLGDYCLNKQEIDEASNYYQRALDLRKKYKVAEDDDLAQTLVGLAECYHSQDDDSTALQTLQRALKINERVHGSGDLSCYTCLTKLAVEYEALDELQQAQSCWQNALAIAEKKHTPEDGLLVETIEELAENLDKQERYADSESLYKRIVLINEHELGITNPGVAGALHGLALNYQDQRKFDEAEQQYKRAIKIIADGTSTESSSTLLELAQGYLNLLYYQKKENQAPTLTASILDLAQKKYHQSEGYFEVLDGLAAENRALKNYALAKNLFEKSLTAKMALHGTNSDAYVSTLVELGDTYHAEHDFSRAAEQFNKALALTQTGFDQAGETYLALLKSTADNYFYAHDFVQAEKFYHRRITQLQKAESIDNKAISEAWYDLGANYYTWGKYKEAQESYKKALDLSMDFSGGDSTDFAYNLWAVANAEGKRNNLQAEENDLRRALEIYEAQNEDTFVMSVAADLTGNLKRSHKLSQIEPVCDAVKAYYERRKLDPDSKKNPGSLEEQYGSFLANTQQYAEAEKTLEYAWQQLKKHKNFQDDDSIELRANLAKSLAAQGKNEQAAPVFASIIEQASNSDFFDAHEATEILRTYASVLEKMHRPDEAKLWASKARAAEPVQTPLRPANS